jgi:RimJ/RimL family protein N-acetyltransferase
VITLRELARSDVQVINRWRQDRALTAGLGAPHRHIGIEVDERWFEAYLQRRGLDVRCAVCPDGEAEPIGLVSLTGIDPVHKHAELHVLIGDRSSHGRGIGTAATRAMLQHAFRDLNLHRVYLFVLRSNIAARRMYEKVGFRHEGTLRESAFKDGAYEDVHVMGLLQQEFRPE